MITTKAFRILKVKLLIMILVLSELMTFLIQNKAVVNASELYPYLNSNKQIVRVATVKTNLDVNIKKAAPPISQKEIEENAKEQIKVSKAIAIDTFLRRKGSPLAGFGRLIIDISEKYNVPANLIVAVSGKESSFCNINFEPYNCWGWMTSQRFTSYSQSLDSYGNYLRSYYFNRGMGSVYGMAKVYCPPTYNDWAAGVLRLMSQMNF